ncbi:lipid II:glycine glycyltransferase FemX [Methylobacterium sp. SyP6R]|uniref:lipid II:glycine glycyltransferase FemX n=1 Tax=Methylobacterium sp. SyP6R TaxID=2718876 RepID=UPI001F3666E9|nr:GNAT family N-acetyltransferase [Methylobacterium sp. SyP6R]MCF4127571.1 GNAT family N-acetyltransferase [Methylobacterium sp. SyP6R]
MTRARRDTGLRIVLVEDVSAWDDLVWAQPGGTIFAASGWGVYKHRRGARIERLSVVDERERLVGLAQVQIRRRGPSRQIYVQGGPLLTREGECRGESVIRRLIGHIAPSPLDLLVVDLDRAASPGVLLGLLTAGFRPVSAPRRHTLEVDLSRGLDAVLAGMDRRWRKALRKALRNPALTARFLEDPAERLAAFDAFAAMYAALKARKGFPSRFDCAAYRDLVAGDPRQPILEVREGDEPCLVRLLHLGRDRTTAFFTAATERANLNGAAYLAVWCCLGRAAEAGHRVFDVGGIDPAANRGVYDFKRGFARHAVTSGPLWIYARSRLVAAAACLVLAR